MIDIIKNKNQYISLWHDYIYNAYIQSKNITHLYSPQVGRKDDFVIDKLVIQTKKLSKSNISTSPLSFHSGGTGNNSAHYYKIKHDKTAPDDEYIAIKMVNSSTSLPACSLSNVKLKILYYKNDTDLPNDSYVQENITLTGINTWVKLNNFKKNDFSHFVIIASISDGKLYSTSQYCTLNLDIAYTSKALLPGRNQNIIMNVDGADIKLDGNFSYRNSINQVLNITSFADLNAIAGIGSTVSGS